MEDIVFLLMMFCCLWRIVIGAIYGGCVAVFGGCFAVDGGCAVEFGGCLPVLW